jgi:hypothetical protein
MSFHHCMMYVDTPIDQEIQTGKDTNLKYIRVRFLKVGDPLGDMTLKIMNQAKTETLGTSTSIACDYSTDINYVGSDDEVNMSWIRFTFNGTALRTGTAYYVRLECDSTYIAGVKEEEILDTWTQDGAYYKATPINATTSLYKDDTVMTSVGSKPAIDSSTKYYFDGTDVWLNFDPTLVNVIGSFYSGINYLMALSDYPKPTNDADGDPTNIETSLGRNFTRYPVLTLQVFGRDFGDD